MKSKPVLRREDSLLESRDEGRVHVRGVGHTIKTLTTRVDLRGGKEREEVGGRRG